MKVIAKAVQKRLVAAGVNTSWRRKSLREVHFSKGRNGVSGLDFEHLPHFLQKKGTFLTHGGGGRRKRAGHWGQKAREDEGRCYHGPEEASEGLAGHTQVTSALPGSPAGERIAYPDSGYPHSCRSLRELKVTYPPSTSLQVPVGASLRTSSAPATGVCQQAGRTFRCQGMTGGHKGAVEVKAETSGKDKRVSVT